MRYVVTGGAGFIGSHIAEALVGGGHEVVIFDNLSSGKRENIEPLLASPRVTFINGTILDVPALRTACEGAEGIFHEAAIVSVPRSVADPPETHDTNLSGTLNVLMAARDSGVKNVLFASSASVYGDAPDLPKQEAMLPDLLSPYAVSKIAGEYYCSVFTRLYGLRCTSLRYFNVFGPRQDPASPYSGVITKFITNTLGNRPLTLFGDGLQTRDFVYVKDVVQANLRAMDAGKPGVYNIAGGTQLSLLDLVGILREITGITVPVVHAPPAPGDVRDSLADITRARESFGYRPAYSVRDGLEATVAWFRKSAE